MSRRSRSAFIVALVLGAPLIAFGPAATAVAEPAAGYAAGGELPEGGPAPTPAAPTSGVSGDTVASVADETELRDALTALSVDGAGPHTIEITADFTITSAVDPFYDGTQDLTIAGGGHTVTSGVADTRFLTHFSNAALTIEDLTVDGFEIEDGAGGAIASDTGLLTVSRSTFRSNIADDDGGAIDFDGEALIEDSTFEDNEAGDGGGALEQNDDAPFVVDGSTFVGNEALGGAAISGEAQVVVVNSTFTDNTGVTIIDSFGGGDSSGEITLTYVTIAGNTLPDDDEPPIATVTNFGDDELNSFGTVIVDSAGGDNCLVDGTTSSYSYSSDDTCGFTGTGDTEPGGDPGLEPLADNGGPTETMAIGEDGPLFDAIPTSACDPGLITVDQRDEPRPGTLTAGCDIGAFELQLVEPIEPLVPVDPGGGGTGGVDDGVGPIAGRPAFTG
jgi:hypothetical protein